MGLGSDPAQPFFQMTLSTTMLTADLSYMFADLPQTITWKGTDYVCSVSDVESNKDLMEEGYNGIYDFYCVIKTADFTNGTLSHGDKFTYDSKEYRVDKISKCQDGISQTIYGVGLTK